MSKRTDHSGQHETRSPRNLFKRNIHFFANIGFAKGDYSAWISSSIHDPKLRWCSNSFSDFSEVSPRSHKQCGTSLKFNPRSPFTHVEDGDVTLRNTSKAYPMGTISELRFLLRKSDLRMCQNFLQQTQCLNLCRHHQLLSRCRRILRSTMGGIAVVCWDGCDLILLFWY